ncbi:MAG: nucleotide exchange factor GrpE [Bacteroidales bacterium]|nr:nucleotide exchange factor GrpE [Bacteroidales bacterium]
MQEKDTLTPEELEAAAMAAANNDTDDTIEVKVADADETAEVMAELTDADKLAQAEAEIAELKDKLLRAVADHTNYRRQMQKQMADLILNGGKKVIEVVLPVLDDMERAQDNIVKSDDIAVAREGLDMIFQKLAYTLELQGLHKMDTPTAATPDKEMAFDTDFHEAVAILPMGEDKKDKIIDTVQAGYMLNDKVLRHAKVVVGA